MKKRTLIINGMPARPREGLFRNNKTGQACNLYYIEAHFAGKWLPLCENQVPRLFGSAAARDNAMVDMAKKYAITPVTPLRVKGS